MLPRQCSVPPAAAAANSAHLLLVLPLGLESLGRALLGRLRRRLRRRQLRRQLRLGRAALSRAVLCKLRLCSSDCAAAKTKRAQASSAACILPSRCWRPRPHAGRKTACSAVLCAPVAPPSLQRVPLPPAAAPPLRPAAARLQRCGPAQATAGARTRPARSSTQCSVTCSVTPMQCQVCTQLLWQTAIIDMIHAHKRESPRTCRRRTAASASARRVVLLRSSSAPRRRSSASAASSRSSRSCGAAVCVVLGEIACVCGCV